VCIGNPTMLNASGGVSYEWSPGADINNGDSTTLAGETVIAVPDDTTQYVVWGTDQNGCRNVDSTKVVVLFPFAAQFMQDSSLCEGECMTLQAVADSTYIFSWTPALFMDSAASATPTVCPTYDIVYHGIVFDGYCFADSGDVSIGVNPLPTVVASSDTTILAGSTAVLVATGSVPGGTYAWIPDSLVACSTCPTTEVTPLERTTYYVTFTDNNGCKADDTVEVTVFCNDASIFIPNAFTPDGDGRNDEYYLKGQGFELKYFRIYNRWGEKVFETSDLAEPWTGKYKGKVSEPEVFVYYLQAVCTSGEVLSKKGNITLIR
jgi:gliding motility-associated-like protein